jgi:hypothetical protein
MIRRIMRFAVPTATVLLLAMACASGSATKPAVTLTQVSGVPTIQVESASGLPIEYRITVDNPLDQPITLVGIEVESVGTSGAYVMNRVKHNFDRTIAARSTDSIDFRAWVQPLSRDSRGEMSGAVMLRGTARFNTANGEVRTNFTSRGK